MTRLSDLLDYLDSCSDKQFLEFCDAMEKRGYIYVEQYVHDYDYPHVIHCKDCKHRKRQFGKDVYCQLVSNVMPPDGYCSMAVGKEGK